MTGYPQIPGISFDGELGRGAHSVVYRGAQDGVACAIKLPRTKARWTRWIYREAVSLARVKHPSLPAVLEVGELDGLPYLVMELVEGMTLADKLADGPLEEDAAIDIARQLASVLARVHDTGLVHRDVKPRNIVIEQSSSVLKLVDFGFATPMERVGPGHTAGTAAYAAPEQLVPPGSVDGRTDLFAVGRVLYECLAGSERIRNLEAPLGLEARSDLVARGVTPGLAEVVAGLLRANPDERYPDARAFQSDLDRLKKGTSVLGPSAYEHDRTAPRLIGRDAELERVLQPCRNVREGGGGAVVLIRGQRGGGKSRLLMAAIKESDRRTPTRVSVSISCRQHDPPLATLRRIFDAYCDELVDGLRQEDLRLAIGNLAPVARLIAPNSIAALLAPASSATTLGSSTDVASVAESLTEGAAEILLRLAQRIGPTILAIDDAQWMDPASVDAVLRLAHRSGEAPIALVLAARSEGMWGEVLSSFSSARPGHTTEIELPRLSEAQVGELVASHLGEATADVMMVGRIHAVAGGTPLGVLEVLGAFLDAGALRPHARAWTFDATRTDRVVLPQGAIVLLGRRLGELPGATRRVLETAAILGTSFDDLLLARAIDVSSEDLGYAMASARRAGLVEVEAEGRHCFVHDSLREMLVDDLLVDERRRLHQRVAEVLDTEEFPSFEELCAAAFHFSQGEKERDPARHYRVARSAGEAALERFDNETALRLHAQAREAAEGAGIHLDTGFFQNMGEAHLRIGSLEESRVALEAALDLASSGPTKAVVLGRLSWLAQSRAEPDEAWTILERSFSAIDARMPVESVRSAASTSARIARWSVGRLMDRETVRSESQIDLLCSLHYQNARLGLEYGKPARVIQSGLASLSLSERGGSAATRARARAFYAFVMTALGRRDAGTREGAKAKEIAARHGDAATIAFCVQLHAVATSWAGDLDHALILFRECVDVHGPWLELNEYCQIVSAAEIIQSLRGRAVEAWPWIERAVERLRRSRSRPIATEFLIHRARAALAAIGRHTVTDDPWLAGQLASVSPRDPCRGYHRLVSWGPRARFYIESGELGSELEELVRSFEAEGHNPSTVHLAVSEYYVSIAHARMHQCLRASVADRPTQLRALRAAVADLHASAKIPLLKAHWRLTAAALAWFEGHDRKAKKLLADAEALANQHSCVWVLSGVARVRAHMLRADGKLEAAHDQARASELFARDHGAVTRARWVREEFALTDPATEYTASLASSQRSSTSRANRQLATLLQVARAPRRDLKADQQAGAILDELINALEGQCAAIWFQPEHGMAVTAVARDQSSEASVSLAPESARGALLRYVHKAGTPWPPPPPPSSSVDAALADVRVIRSAEEEVHAQHFDVKRVLAVPLFIYEKPVGALCIERSPSGAPFRDDDRNLLVLLSHQVPIALEIARLLVEREQLHASLQHAKKMEAMGALAGGIAHDFNNMLAAMRYALNVAQERAALDVELAAELDIISEVTQKAAQLTGQLLSFSRHQPVPVAAHDVNQLIATLEPMLKRIVGGAVKVVSKLSPAVDAVEVDQSSFDQAIVNLFINARDAMPNGGTLSITTKNVVLTEMAAQRVNLTAGEYVEIEVRDTGEGMSADTLTRIFEPFFTTKPTGKGSGLGLAMVYAFTRNCGGSIEVSSEVGQGTQFRLYLRRVDRSRTSRPAGTPNVSSRPPSRTPSSLPLSSVPSPPPSTPPMKIDGPDTILVVDDDDLVRRSIAKILERNGYRVVAASGSMEALSVAREQGARIALVILDVLMPGLTGPELSRRFDDLNLQAKLLFVSGFAPESIPMGEAKVAADMLLQKPFSQTALLERVRLLMRSSS